MQRENKYLAEKYLIFYFHYNLLIVNHNHIVTNAFDCFVTRPISKQAKTYANATFA